MINVGFLLNFQLDYKGGINYYKNLFTAVQATENKNITIKLFVPSGIDEEYLLLFSNVEIIKTGILKRKSFKWFVDKVFGKLFNCHILTENLLKKHKINVLSHSNIIAKNKSIKNVNWIPDFQFIHYPNMWSAKQLASTEKLYSDLIARSERIVVSSYDAFNDLSSRYPDMINKVRVLHFVSQPFYPLNTINLDQLNRQIKIYTENDKYFYLPNQFWSHKNHLTVFKACEKLIQKEYDFKLITSGFMKDYRNNDHIKMLTDYVDQNSLNHVIKFLGLIPYEHVFSLNLFSLALINPSQFEGWSSTVEEAKTIGTRVILSDINVHREQNPPNALYFDAKDVDMLVAQMEKVFLENPVQEKASLHQLHDKLLTDTKLFGNNYINIIQDVLKEL